MSFGFNRTGLAVAAPLAEFNFVHFKLATRWTWGSLQLSVPKLSDAGYISAVKASTAACWLPLLENKKVAAGCNDVSSEIRASEIPT